MLDPVRQTLRFAATVTLAALLAGTVGAIAWHGVAAAVRVDPLFAWVASWLGDAAGMLVVTPGLLLLFHPRLREDRVTAQPFPLICLGLGLTAFCSFATGLGVRDAQTERFKADTGRLAMTLQTHVELTARDLETLQPIHGMLALHAGARLVDAPPEAPASGLDHAMQAFDRLQHDAMSAAGGVRRGALRTQLLALAHGAAAGSMTQVRERLGALAAAPPPSLPEGLLAQLEGDLRQYDFATLESRVRDALAQDGAADDDGHALQGAVS